MRSFRTYSSQDAKRTQRGGGLLVLGFSTKIDDKLPLVVWPLVPFVASKEGTRLVPLKA